MKKIEEIEELLEDIGELDEYNVCPICNKKSLFRIDKYDAYCCVICNIWNEEKCSDPKCDYCATRPELPIDAINEKSEHIQKIWQELIDILKEK